MLQLFPGLSKKVLQPVLKTMEHSIGGFEAERRGVIASSASDLFLAWLIPLVRSHNLASYDATYLDLALRLSATLASFDCRLI